MITRFYKGAVSQLVILSMVSMLPANDASAICCVQQDKCCEEECCDGAGGGFFSGSRGALLGGALLGAAAGAAAGAAVSSGHKGKHGSDGRRGPRGFTGATGAAGTGVAGPAGPAGATGATGATGAVGPAGPAGADSFTPDPDPANTLTFDFTLAGVALGTGTLTPYVIAPDGTMTEGPAVALGLIPPLPVIPSIVIDGLDYGTYISGVQVINDGLIALGVTVTQTVTALSDGSVTTVLAPGVDLGLLGAGESQTNAAYGYGPGTVP